MATARDGPLGQARADERAQLTARLRRMTTALARAQRNIEGLAVLGAPATLLELGPRQLGDGTGFSRVMISRLEGPAMVPVSLWSAGRAVALPALTIELGYPLVEAELAQRPGARRVEPETGSRRSPAGLREALGWRSYAVATITLAGAPVGLLHAEPEPERLADEFDVELAGLLATGFAAAFEVASLHEALAAHRDVQRAAVRQLTAALTADDQPQPAATIELLEALTGREQEVLERLAHGRTNREVAAEMLISEATVKYHVHNLLRKLGATSRTEAVARHLAARGLGAAAGPGAP